MYSTKSDTTKEVCEKLGFNFEVGFVETMKQGNDIYVGFTLGKPNEIRALANAALNAGFKLSTGLKKAAV